MRITALKKGTAVPRGCFWARCCARYHQSLASESRRLRPLCFPLQQESGFKNDKCKQKSYNHTMCVHLSFCMLFWYAHLYFRMAKVSNWKEEFLVAFKQLSRDITADQGLLMSSTTAPSSKLLLRLKSNVSTFRQVYLGVLQVGQTWHCLDRVVRTVCWAVGDEFYSSVQIGRGGQFDYWKGLFKKKTKKPCISRRKVT